LEQFAVEQDLLREKKKGKGGKTGMKDGDVKKEPTL